MTFVVPASDAEKPENRFEFQIGETTHSVPLFKFAPVEASLLFEEGRGLEGLFACMTPQTEAAVRLLDREQLKALDDAWTAASKVSPGESQGSDDS